MREVATYFPLAKDSDICQLKTQLYPDFCWISLLLPSTAQT